MMWIETVGPNRDLCIQVLEKAASHDPFGKLASAQELCANARVFALVEGERLLAAYAGQTNKWKRGSEYLVLAAAATRDANGIDCTSAIHTHAESIATYEGCVVLTCCTERPGLAKKLIEQGCKQSGVIVSRVIA